MKTLDMNYGYSKKRNKERYNAILPYIIDPKFSLLDFGSNYGYFSTAFALNFPESLILSIENESMSYTTDPRFGKDGMLDFHKNKTIELGIKNNSIFLVTITPEFFKLFIKEKIIVDYHLMLSFIHWLPMQNREEFEEVLKDIILSARTTFLEVPQPTENQRNGKIIMKWYDGRTNALTLINDTIKKYELPYKAELIGSDIKYRPIARITANNIITAPLTTILDFMLANYNDTHLLDDVN